ncbi:tail fiber protein, partial [Xenorhabdus bovienii]|uniref:tail fiber protein n=1 Tax=Xenorhabdus bovienii TaxID=40576 RepID=UPI0023B32745
MKNPNLIPKPFAQNGHRDEIPAGYKSDLPSQKATWDTGFPQITMMPVTAGGLPPSGRDFNGVFNQISDNIVHLSKGGKYKFSQEYANSINGYPKGAILQSDDETKEFQSLIDNNKINFNTESADKVNSAWKLVNTNQLLDELNKKLNRSDVVQSIGSSQSTVMSQKAATDALNEKQPKGDYATNSALNAVNDNANTRLEKSKNGADIPDPKRFVENLGLAETKTQAANAYPKTGGVIDGEVHANRLTSREQINIGFGDRLGMRDGGIDAASFAGNNLDILSWNGIGFKSTESGKTNVYVNTRTGDIITQGLI